MKRYRNLTANEIVAQVEFAISHAGGADPAKAKEFKINYTRMGEPFLNIEAVKEAIRIITEKYPNTHHYVSTIGIKGSDFSFIKGNITLQISLHSFDDEKRNFIGFELNKEYYDKACKRIKFEQAQLTLF